ncbi:MAG: DUF4965 domain-containing protein [Clostridia bacterium]|nr:DUF4965 domain-containing protein [Clostridia bacterium]
MKKSFRAPAVPLVTHDPMFSNWSFATRLTDDTTRHWTGVRQYMIGTVAIDHKIYQFLGTFMPVNDRYGPAYPALPQVKCEIRPMTTRYVFRNEIIQLEITFTSPLLLNDLSILSRPVTYLTYKVTPLDGREHEVRLYFGFSGEFCVDNARQEVFFGTDTLSTFVSSGTEHMLETAEDDRRIEWGSFHVIAPQMAQDVKGLMHFLHGIYWDHADLKFGINSPHLPGPRPFNYGPDWYDGYRKYKLDDHYPTLCFDQILTLKDEPYEDKILLAYDDVKSLEYFGEQIEAYWRKDGDDFQTLMRRALDEYEEILAKVKTFEDDLLKRAKALSPKYADILSLAYRQAIAGHKLTWHDGEIQFISKENFSNGSAGTVDVTYPSIPLFLLYAPELVEGMLNPVFKMIRKGLWTYEFAPHDVGTYPKCNAQAYGFYLRHRRNTRDPFTKQMPVEECGNMILCVAGVVYAEKKFDYFLKHEAILGQWAEYLVRIGYDPENQLCTDDFAGHLAHNLNLSVKGICGVAAYGKMLRDTGRKAEGEKYLKTARSMAKKWEKEGLDAAGDHYKLAFDQDGTWSIKYNMVWDRLLGLGLFSQEVYDKEIAYYKTRMNPYGLPLDNRADYTKTDWEIWATVLTDDREFFDMIVDRMWDFLCDTPDRAPFTDWHFTTHPLERGFQARTVQGGLFFKLLTL